jgi:two-component system, OmpR family, heavy metal sensor histidine kinase CusS
MKGSSRFGRMSIAVRLMAFYTLSAFLILSSTNAILYWEMVKKLEQNNDHSISDEIDVMKDMLRGQDTEKEFYRETVLEHAERKYIKHYVRILDGKGDILIESPQMETIIPPAAFPSPREDYIIHGDRFEFRARNGNLYILKSLRTQISGFGGKGKVLQMALDVSDVDIFIDEYRAKLVKMLALGVLISAVAGTIVSLRGLRPLSKITQTAQRITANRLNERIDPKQWPKELFSLAVAFDSMLDRLEASIEGLTQYSANLAHELRTPINNLMVEADIALSRTRTPDEYIKVIGSNMEEYSRLSRIIDSLLFLARTDNAQTGLQIALVDVRQEIEDIAEFYSAMAGDKGITISCTGEAALRADPVLFRRAVSNLLANAINYTESEGEVVLCARRGDGHSVEVVVSDTGCGIAAEHLPRVFERFYRGASIGKPGTQGSGLGLAIVKSIMELHGGVIEVKSESNKGTTATMRFFQTS